MGDLKNNIIDKIKTGEIDMKPKWYFMLKTALLITGVIIIGLLAIYLLSFVMFALHNSGILFAPSFGFRGIGLFITTSPWILILLVAVFLSILYILVKQYSFSYKQPFLYSMLGVIFLVIIGSFAVRETLHERIGVFTERNQIPGMSPFYKSAHEKLPEGITFGTIEEVLETGFIITDTDGETLTIITDSKTRQKPGSSYSDGDKILIYGDKTNEDTVNAYGIRKADEEFKRRHQIHNQDSQLIKPFNNRGDGQMRQFQNQ